MKLYKVLNYFLCLGLLLLMAACENPRETEAREEMQEFETWLDEKSNQTEEWSEQEWRNVKSEYQEFETEMEENVNELSEESKTRYNDLKGQYKEWESEVESDMNAKKAKKAKAEWKNKMLGQYSDTSAITADNVSDAYASYIENVKSQHEQWSDKEWDHAEELYETLNDKKAKLEDKISKADKKKIKKLQKEYDDMEKS